MNTQQTNAVPSEAPAGECNHEKVISAKPFPNDFYRFWVPVWMLALIIGSHIGMRIKAIDIEHQLNRIEHKIDRLDTHGVLVHDSDK